MTDTVNLNTNLSDSAALYNTGNLVPAATGTTTTAGSVFSNDPLSLFSKSSSTGFGSSSIFSGSGSCNFQDDMLMSGFDFDSLVYDPNTQTIMRDKTKQAQNQIQTQGQTTQTAVTQGQSTGVQNESQGAPNFSELDNYLVRDKDTNTPASSNIGKTAGAVIGCSLPLAESLLSGIKSGKFLKGMNWKQLAVTCPVVGLAGLGIGYVADKLINQFNPQPTQQAAEASSTTQQVAQIQQQTVLPQAA